MDLLVFPSHTDTFGNVVLEALASGVPAIVTPSGGPKFIVQHGHTGFIAANDDFAAAIATLAHDPQRLARMRLDAREYALTCSWDAVFDRVYAAYDTILPPRLEAL
jgi:glycosyltransferase involved in cell wall biosynthesis